MCCHASEKFQERKQLISKPDQHLLHINMKVIGKIKKRKKGNYKMSHILNSVL